MNRWSSSFLRQGGFARRVLAFELVVCPANESAHCDAAFECVVANSQAVVRQIDVVDGHQFERAVVMLEMMAQGLSHYFLRGLEQIGVPFVIPFALSRPN